MKNLTAYIKEDLDIENLFWRIETYFKRKPQEYTNFVDIVKQCANDTVVSKDNLEVYIKKYNLNIKNLIDFLDDDINGQCEKDYVYLLKKVIETLLANKSIEMW